MDDLKIESKLKNYSPDYIINCIGLINRYANLNESLAKKVNSVYPHLLAYICIKNNWKLIHISTDCYLDKDFYGKSKFLGEVNDRQNLTIRTSIIGPELKEGRGLFHWFLSQKDSVNGFTKAYWDGVTTLQLAKFIKRCIDYKNLTGIIDYRTKKSLDKYSLLKIISKIFNKNINIKEDDRKIKDKRNFNADFWCNKNYKKQISELKKYIAKNSKKYAKYLR